MSKTDASIADSTSAYSDVIDAAPHRGECGQCEGELKARANLEDVFEVPGTASSDMAQ